MAILVKDGPSGVFASSGHYLNPDREMHEKGWKGADLIFDIDADQLPTDCKNIHDIWTCKECRNQGKGARPDKCKCGSTKIMQLNWVCEECLSKAKYETLKLIDFLTEDFGVSSGELNSYFSGNMGYHVVVESVIFESVDQMARNEIADYIAGRGIRPETIGIYKRSLLRDIYPRIPLETEPGWRGRIAGHFKELRIEDYSEGEEKTVRDKIAYIYSRKSFQKFKKRLEDVVQNVGVTIDTSVTTDVHRIFRMPGTLNGKTGLMKMKCNSLEDFDPLTDPVVLDEEPISVTINVSPPFILRGQKFNPPRMEHVSLPKMAAVYLLTRGLAKIG